MVKGMTIGLYIILLTQSVEPRVSNSDDELDKNLSCESRCEHFNTNLFDTCNAFDENKLLKFDTFIMRSKSVPDLVKIIDGLTACNLSERDADFFLMSKFFVRQVYIETQKVKLKKITFANSWAIIDIVIDSVLDRVVRDLSDARVKITLEDFKTNPGAGQ